jgi:hypothetical protein
MPDACNRARARTNVSNARTPGPPQELPKAEAPPEGSGCKVTKEPMGCFPSAIGNCAMELSRNAPGTVPRYVSV